MAEESEAEQRENQQSGIEQRRGNLVAPILVGAIGDADNNQRQRGQHHAVDAKAQAGRKNIPIGGHQLNHAKTDRQAGKANHCPKRIGPRMFGLIGADARGGGAFDQTGGLPCLQIAFSHNVIMVCER